MKQNSKMTRRLALQAGLGLAAGATASLAGAASVTPAVGEGPFFPKRPQADRDEFMDHVEGREGRAKGDAIMVHIRVVDEGGAAVSGAVVDLWQANAAGRYDHEDDPNPAPLDPNFQSWAHLKTDAEGRVSVRTIKPGAYPANENWSRPPHLHFKVAKRGYRELITQMFFAGEPLNDTDRLYLDIPPERRGDVTVAFAPGPHEAAHGEFTMVIGKVAAA